MSGARKTFDPEDPMALVGVAFDADPEAAEAMARCLVEEYLRQGWDEARLLTLFRTPFYRALHVIYRQRGEDGVRALIADVATTWGIWRVTEQSSTTGGTDDA